MRIALLHLSDLHFKEQKNVIAFRKEKIAGALRSLGHFGATFLVVSGDVTYSGQRKQYDEAFDFFVALRDEITCDRTLGAVHFVAVPGNHDCDLSKDSQAREILIANVLRSAVELTDPSVVDNLTSIQDDFFSFLEVMTGNKPSGIQRINYHFTFEVGDRRIFFDCYNTAWMLGKDQGPNQVILPLQSLPESQSLSGSGLNCAVFHHPYVWFKLENGRQFRKRIENSCQVVLTGHEHDVSQVAQKRISGEVNEYLEGGILQSDSEYESSFNIQTIDLDQHQSQCLQFNWEEDIYKSAKQSSPVSLRTSKLARAFQNDLEFEEWLNDPEIDFVSKNREQTKLEDIYVYPDLRVLDPERISLGTPHVTISGDKLAEYILTSERVIIAGSDRSGKTALLKMLYKAYLKSGYVPILVGGNEIRANKDRTDRLVQRLFNKQYSEDNNEEFRQLPSSRRVLLLDDLHRAGLGFNGKCALVKQFLSSFDKVIITTDELIGPEELVQTDSPFVSFKHCVLPDLGFQARGRLIERWVTRAQKQEEEETEISYRVKTLENSINALMRTRILPSNPFVLLAVLQILEGSTPLNTVSGAYGYLYEFLITGAFAKTSTEAADLDVKYSFLSELAYHMFELRVDEIAYNDIQKVADHYFEESRIRLKLESLVDELLSSKVIKKKDELYRFCHPYTYNYFVARYLRNNLRDTDKGEAVREKIGQLVRNLHEQDFANIIIFLCYLSQDPMLVDEILAAARSIFHGTVPCKLGQEVSFLNKDIKGEPEVTVMDTDPRVAREASRKQSDELEQQRSLQDTQQNGSIGKSPDNEEADLSEVRHALNTLHVMGQILRNFPGSLKGKAKVGIAVECCRTPRIPPTLTQIIAANSPTRSAK